MTAQEQFLDCIDRDEAERRFRAAVSLAPLGVEVVLLADALARTLALDVLADVDVPSFDRANVDGYAVRAADTHGAAEESPRRLRLLGETIATGVVPSGAVASGEAMAIATGGMLPRGADSVVMVEYTDIEADIVVVRRASTAGSGVSFAGTDIARGETVLRRGELLTSRETGVLAAIGIDEVAVWRRPVVAILSTGDELIAPGEPMAAARVYDSNARILADAVRELGCEPRMLGIVRDDLAQLEAKLAQAIASADAVLLSGGTSKGEGDISYRAVAKLRDPGIVAHGVALKPGKPICLAATAGKPVVVLPGFPTSAIFTFHEFVAPVLTCLAGRRAAPAATISARLAVKVNSEIGRTEYLLVGLAERGGETIAYPMGKGSGSVTAFSRADGFVAIDRFREIVAADERVDVTLLGRELRAADLVVIGSHCVGLDYLLGELADLGFQAKFLAVGSTAGLQAAARGECDLAGVHLFDAATGQYNRPFLTPELDLVQGYRRRQGVVFRPEDARFAGGDAKAAIDRVKSLPDCVMVNRNQGSGTRILIDRALAGVEPQGYAVQARNHNAVAAAVVQGRADWGVAVEWVARQNELGFLPLAEEHYDFAVPKSRAGSPAVLALRDLLDDSRVRARLREMGLVVD